MKNIVAMNNRMRKHFNVIISFFFVLNITIFANCFRFFKISVYTTLIFTIVIGFFCCSLIINCLLIVGAMLKSHFFFIPFLGYKTLMIILTCVALGFESNDASNSSFTALVIQEIIEMGNKFILFVLIN